MMTPFNLKVYIFIMNLIGGIVLDRYLQQYSSYLFLLETDIDENALYVLYQLQCKANEIIMNNNANSSLLNTSIKWIQIFIISLKIQS